MPEAVFGWTMLIDLAAFVFLLWLVYRIVRKAGFSVGYACKLLAACAGVTGIGWVANLLLTVANSAQLSTLPADYLLQALVLRHLSEVILSSSVLGLLPLAYFSFRRWPEQKEATALEKSS
jgi:hypothetical protein